MSGLCTCNENMLPDKCYAEVMCQSTKQQSLFPTNIFVPPETHILQTTLWCIHSEGHWLAIKGQASWKKQLFPVSLSLNSNVIFYTISPAAVLLLLNTPSNAPGRNTGTGTLLLCRCRQVIGILDFLVVLLFGAFIALTVYNEYTCTLE